MNSNIPVVILLAAVLIQLTMINVSTMHIRENQKQIQEEGSTETQLINAEDDKKDKKDSTFLLTGAFISAIIQVESNGNKNAVSPAGARGLMQIMKPTWDEVTKKIYGETLPFDKAFDPDINCEVGIYYLRWIKRQLLKNKRLLPAECPLEDLIAAAYNGGIGRLKRNGYDISKMPKETRNYVQKIKKFDRGY